MNRNRVEKIIEYVKGSPETMDYGRWGALNPEQRKNIKELCNSWLILDKATNIQTKEIERLNNIKQDLLYVLSQLDGYLDKGWTIDLNFTDIREKYKKDIEDYENWN